MASDEEDRNNYDLASTITTDAYGYLEGADKATAFTFRKAAENGDYLGDPLDKERCDSIRKMLYLKE